MLDSYLLEERTGW